MDYKSSIKDEEYRNVQAMDYKLAANLDAANLFPSFLVKISFYFNERIKN